MPATKTAPALEPFAFTVDDACAQTKLGRSTIYGAIKTGELAILKVGDRTLIEPSELRRWLRTKRQAPAG
jgi:excisionase family DNA binding protein